MAENFEEFKEQLTNIMVFQPVKHEDFVNDMHDWYVYFKETDCTDVENWANDWFEDVSFDTHTYMLKSKAIKDRDERAKANAH